MGDELIAGWASVSRRGGSSRRCLPPTPTPAVSLARLHKDTLSATIYSG